MAGGRPTKFKEEYCEQARKLCLLGYTDAELAIYFEVTESTINKWKLDYPKFSESLKDGKENADAKVIESLYKRAQGYMVDEETAKGPTTRHIPADTTAMIFWLKNRQRKKWTDKQEIEHSGEIENKVTIVDDIK